MYHVNNDLEVLPCGAKSPQTCKFYHGEDDSRHFPDKGSAMKAMDEIARKETGDSTLFSTKKPDYDYADMDKKERTKKMSEDLEKAVDDIVRSGNLKKYFDAMARNGANRWSFTNVVMAGVQLHGWKTRNGIKSNVLDDINNLHAMGANQWKKEGRYVSSGKGSALYILAPMIKKQKLLKADGSPELDDKGKPRTLDMVYGYRAVPVFDAVQTKGDPIPENNVRVQPVTKEIDPKYVDDMKNAIKKEGFTYKETEISGTDPEKLKGRLGYTTLEHEVVVDSRLTNAQKASVIAHELSHIKMGHVTREKMVEYQNHRGEMETEAEGCAYMLMRRAGLDTEGAKSFSPAYIAGWSKGDSNVVKKALNKITSRFGRITDELGW